MNLPEFNTEIQSNIESTAEIKTTSIIIKAHEGSRQTLNITSEKIDSKVKSGGFLNISGKTTSHRLSILGGGICEAENLLTEQSTVKVTAGGRVLTEGIDYTVNYQIGRVKILDNAIKA